MNWSGSWNFSQSQLASRTFSPSIPPFLSLTGRTRKHNLPHFILNPVMATKPSIQDSSNPPRVPTYIPQDLALRIQSLLSSTPDSIQFANTNSTSPTDSTPQLNRSNSSASTIKIRSPSQSQFKSTSFEQDSGIATTSLTEHLASLFPTPSSLGPQNLEKVHALTRERIESSRNEVERLAGEIRADEKDGRMERVDDGMKVSN